MTPRFRQLGMGLTLYPPPTPFLKTPTGHATIDGVNDAPQGDCGTAVFSATDAACAVAALVLTASGLPVHFPAARRRRSALLSRRCCRPTPIRSGTNRSTVRGKVTHQHHYDLGQENCDGQPARAGMAVRPAFGPSHEQQQIAARCGSVRHCGQSTEMDSWLRRARSSSWRKSIFPTQASKTHEKVRSKPTSELTVPTAAPVS
jgi:hypothetical protein